MIFYCKNIKIQLTVTDPNVFQQKCIDKEDKVYRGNNQVVNLTTNYIWSGCAKKEKLSLTHLDCSGKSILQSLKDSSSEYLTVHTTCTYIHVQFIFVNFQ